MKVFIFYVTPRARSIWRFLAHLACHRFILFKVLTHEATMHKAQAVAMHGIKKFGIITSNIFTPSCM